ncbi:MAG: HipA family kinase, partial [Chloroflexota bacterium]
GQGPKALIAELLAAEIGIALDLAVPEPAIVHLGEGFGRSESDPEIQDLLRGSVGPNFGLRFLSGAMGFDPAIDCQDIDPEFAAKVVWFDAYISNVDRTVRNPNMLYWDGRLWLIDHGAALYFHHSWAGWEDRIQSRFPRIKDHVLLHEAGDLQEVDYELAARLDHDIIAEIVAVLPDEWLAGEDEFDTEEDHRAAYVRYLTERLAEPRHWLDEAMEAKAQGPKPYKERVTRRVV